MRDLFGDTVVGVDIDPVTARRHQEQGRNVLLGDPSDADFWERVQATHTLEVVMLALPLHSANLDVLAQLKAVSFDGTVAVIAKFGDEVEALQEAGATTVFNVYAEAGSGFVTHLFEHCPEIEPWEDAKPSG